jgi:hypothetical protein
MNIIGHSAKYLILLPYSLTALLQFPKFYVIIMFMVEIFR